MSITLKQRKPKGVRLWSGLINYMPAYKTQYQYLIELLKERGAEGINSYERFNGKIRVGQLPARIFYLERPPYSLRIAHRDNKDGSTTYILNSLPVEVKQRVIYEGNTARLVSEVEYQQMNQSEQLSL